MLFVQHFGRTVRHALGVPGLSVAIMGMKSVSELEKAAATVQAYKLREGNQARLWTTARGEPANSESIAARLSDRSAWALAVLSFGNRTGAGPARPVGEQVEKTA